MSASNAVQVLNMDIKDSLSRFIESAVSDTMGEAASQLLELVEEDEVEPIGAPGDAIASETLAERLENRLSKLRKRSDRLPDGIELIEDAVATLRTNDGLTLYPWSFEDSDGIRWFVLADEDEEVIVCYTSAPFIEADV
ncbi:MAG: hypothetical protein AAFV29_14525 [Myxococcota bacterium]